MVYVNGQHTQGLDKNTAYTTYLSDLQAIGLLTPDNPNSPAVIMFMGCIACMGQAGTGLLIALSRIWSHRKVVAYATLGYAPGGEMKRRGESCTEPGMRDTTTSFPGAADRDAGRYWRELNSWPWASESSTHAKVALDGQIIHGAQW